jgi:hypothetical protein
MIRSLLKLFRRERWTDADIEHYERMFRLEERQQQARQALGLRWVAAERSTFTAWNCSPVIEIESGPVPTVQPRLYIVRQAG